MSIRMWKTAPMGALLMGTVAAVIGCAKGTDYADVERARDAAREEQSEVADASQEAEREIAEAKQEEQEVRREVLKPVTEDEIEKVREAEQNTEATRRAAAETVKEEEREAREAAKKVTDTEARYAATKQRDEYVAEVDAMLKSADERIAMLKEKADKAEGVDKDSIDRQITALQTARDQVDEHLGTMKSADVLKWTDSREAVQEAAKALKAEMDKTA